MNTTLRLCLAAAAAATAALLSACGGGSDPAPTPADPTATTMPDSATASVRAYTEFTSALITAGQAGPAATPLLLNTTQAPVSESAVPLPVL